MTLCGAVALITVIPWGETALADAPVQQGWWSSLNPGNGASLPAPPDVPANGLLIEGGAGSTSGASDASPAAYAGLVYSIGSGATAGTLTLVAASNTATTPTTALELCPLASSAWAPEQGGPVSDAPAFNCQTNVTAASSNGTYQFQVANLVNDGDLAVAILPTTPVDRVVLAQPDTNSLTVEQSQSSTVPTTPALSGTSGSDTSGSSSAAAPMDGTASAVAPADQSPLAPDTVQPAGIATADSAAPSAASVAAPEVAAPPSAASAAAPASGPPAADQSTSPAAAPVNAAFEAGHRGGYSSSPWVALLALGALLVAGIGWFAAGRSAERVVLDDGPA